MPAGSDAWISRQFSALSAGERRRFLAALWEARGYETSVEGGRVLVRGDETREFAVVGRWPVRSSDADVFVGTHDTDRARAHADDHDAEFVSPAAMRRLLLYGIDRDAADELTREYFGTAVTDARPLRHRSPVSPPALFSVLTVAMVVIIAVSLGTAPAASSTPQISGDSGADLRAANESLASASLSLSTDQSCASACDRAVDDSPEPPKTADAQALLQLHRTQLAREPQRVTFLYTGPSNTSFKSGVLRERISFRTNGTHGRYVRQQRIANGSEAPTQWTDDVYVDDQGVWIHRNDRTRPLRNHVWQDLQRSLLWPYHTIPDQMRVTRIQLRGGEFYRLTAETDSTKRANYRAIAYLTPSERLVYLSISYDHPETGEPVSIEIEYDPLEPDTEISPPSWYREAVLETDDN